jgi:hypothetical protein
MMTMDEKYNWTERAMINDHEAVRGLNTLQEWFLGGTPTDS